MFPLHDFKKRRSDPSEGSTHWCRGGNILPRATTKSTTTRRGASTNLGSHFEVQPQHPTQWRLIHKLKVAHHHQFWPLCRDDNILFRCRVGLHFHHRHRHRRRTSSVLLSTQSTISGHLLPRRSKNAAMIPIARHNRV